MEFDVLKWNVKNKIYKLKPITVFDVSWLQIGPRGFVRYNFVCEHMPHTNDYTTLSAVAAQRGKTDGLHVDDNDVKELIQRAVNRHDFDANWTRLHHDKNDIITLETDEKINYIIDSKSGYFTCLFQDSYDSAAAEKFYKRKKSGFEKLSNAGSIVLPFCKSKKHVERALWFFLNQKKHWAAKSMHQFMLSEVR